MSAAITARRSAYRARLRRIAYGEFVGASWMSGAAESHELFSLCISQMLSCGTSERFSVRVDREAARRVVELWADKLGLKVQE